MEVSVLLGAPGSGKGTQAKKLAEAGGYVHFSTGDMLRKAVKEGTPTGKEVQSILGRGELVPDNVMIAIIREALSSVKSGQKAILDGFPRTVPQAEALEKDPLTSVKKAVYFKVPDGKLVERLTGRRTCGKCGEPYHVTLIPPKKSGVCDKCGSELVQRADDTPEVVKNRLSVFHKQNDGLTKFYQAKNRLFEIDADQSVDGVRAALLSVLSR